MTRSFDSFVDCFPFLFFFVKQPDNVVAHELANYVHLIENYVVWLDNPLPD